MKTINVVLASGIIELSENKSKFAKIRKAVCRWESIVLLSLFGITAKVAVEQVLMILKGFHQS